MFGEKYVKTGEILRNLTKAIGEKIINAGVAEQITTEVAKSDRDNETHDVKYQAVESESANASDKGKKASKNDASENESSTKTKT